MGHHNLPNVTRWPGTDPAVVALHGFTGAGSDFAPLVRRLQNAVAAPDLAGHADAPAAAASGYDFMQQAAALGALPRALALDRPVLLGYSFGGRLALQMLVDAPHAFRAAVLIGATPGIEDDAERATRAAADEARAARILELGAPAFLNAWAKLPLIATQNRIAPADRARMRQARGAHSAAGLAGALRGAGTGTMPPLWSHLCELRLPVLLLTGSEDCKFDAIATRMCSLLPDAEHVRIPAAGHCAHLEAPAATAAAIGAFLSARQESRRPPDRYSADRPEGQAR